MREKGGGRDGERGRENRQCSVGETKKEKEENQRERKDKKKVNKTLNERKTLREGEGIKAEHQ